MTTTDLERCAEWRQKARDWLAEELAALKEKRAAANNELRLRWILRDVERLQSAEEFKGVRDEEEVAGLAEDEQEQCRALWTKMRRFAADVQSDINRPGRWQR